MAALFSFFRRAAAPPSLDWIQVEVTTHCDARCTYCPHAAYADRWERRHMDMALFARLVPDFPAATMIYLQGWGEPLLHPEFFTMLRLAKDAGCRVGTTSNANRLDEAALERLVDAGLDDIAFSLAGVTPATNDAIRKGTSLDKVLWAMERLDAIKKAKGSATPTVRAAYMLLRSDMDAMRRFPALLAARGVRDGMVSTLGFVCAGDMEREAFMPSDKEGCKKLKKLLFGLSMGAAMNGVNLFYHLPTPKKRRQCTEHPDRGLVVGVSGDVTACVLGSLPLRGNVAFRFEGRNVPFVPRTLGNIRDTTLAAIRASEAYAAFVAELAASTPRPGICDTCLKRFAVME
ncbi:MAG: radical SAM/SPASM domain-containing protein [Desulfovibrionaceae bacterium]